MPLTFPSNPNDGQTASYVFTDTNGVEIKRLWTFDSGASSWVATPSNLGSNGSGRYFYGPNSPTVDDIVMGERWFDTVVGTEYTYLPVAEGSTYLAWIDLDHLGQNESGDEYVKKSGDTMNGTLTGTDASFDSITATNGFIGTLTGNIADFGHITADTGFIGGSLTADRAFRASNEGFVDDEFITKNYYETNGFYVKKSGDTMSGDLNVNRAFRDNNSSPFDDDEFITKEYAENNFSGGASGLFSGGGLYSVRLVTSQDFDDFGTITLNPLTDVGYPGPYTIHITWFMGLVGNGVHDRMWSRIGKKTIYNVLSGSENFKIQALNQLGVSPSVDDSPNVRTLKLTRITVQPNQGPNYIISIGPYR